MLRAPKCILHRERRHFTRPVKRPLLDVERVVPGSDSVLLQDPLARSGRPTANTPQKIFHLVVADRFAWQKLSHRGDVNVVHRETSLWLAKLPQQVDNA